jgi:hypothetical protein
MFREINPSVWTYEKDGDAIEGILVKIEKGVGANESTIYSIETSPEVFKSVWGSVILDQKMSLMKEGQKIRITYKGLSEKKPGKNPAKIFKVEVDQEEEIKN